MLAKVYISFGKSDKQLLEVGFRIHELEKYDLNPSILTKITTIFINCNIKVLSFIWENVVILNKVYLYNLNQENLATKMKWFHSNSLIKMQSTHN